MNAERARALFVEQRDANYRRTDRLFAALLVGQWAFAIVLSLVVSPLAWRGQAASIHLHVAAATILGGLLCSFPLALVWLRPGSTASRHVIAIAQMLWSALLIHLSGGRIETHFHVFGSLAFLAFYRDWKVLVPATLVVLADHLLRGLFWPESVYGIANPEWWRFLEHTFWVAFEDVVLVLACLRGADEMRQIAEQRARVESLSESELSKKSLELARALGDLQASQEQLVRNEKLAAVGQLAASVAHEVRNPLAAICGAASYVSRRTTDGGAASLQDPRIPKFLGIIVREAGVVTKIVDDLLDFARERPPQLAPCPPRALVTEALEAVRIPTGVNARLANDVPEGFAVPLADRDLLRQAVINLVQNALEAMPAGRPGAVSVGAERSNGTWRLVVADDGVGIPPDIRERVFQPLFTTKNKGTGLGLAIVASIAKRHQGSVRLESEAGRGTSVTLELPLEPAGKEPVPAAAAEGWVT
jgi:signal transduction histidine kinase